MKKYLKANKLLLIFVFLLSLAVSFGVVYLAVILQNIVNIATTGTIDEFVNALITSAVYLLALGVCKYIYGIGSKILVKKITRNVREDIFQSIMRKDLSEYNDKDSGEYISILTNDIKIIEENFILPLFKIMENAVLFCFAFFMIMYISPEVLLALILCMVIMAAISAFFGKILQRRQGIYSKEIGIYTGGLKDLLGGYEVFKYYKESENAIQEHSVSNSDLAQVKYKLDFCMAVNQSTSDLLGILTMFLVIVIGAYKVISGTVMVGTLVALVQLSNSFVTPIMEITMNIPKLQSIKSIIKKINKIHSHVEAKKEQELTTFRSGIKLEHVYFSYDRKNPVLKDINLFFEKGKKYLILGKSGSGKSTLLGLLAGKCKGFMGSIYCDEYDLKEWNIGRLCGVIQQSTYIFNRSIRENIRLYKKYPDNTIEQVLFQCGFQNLDLDKNSLDLSGGQKQRISVARALIREKPILLMDEGTSAVDITTGNEIEKTLLSDKDITLITISHKMNPEMLKKYDQIIYLENGHIAEKGTYSQVVGSKGNIYQLLEKEQAV